MKKILIILVVLSLLGGGGFGVYAYMMGGILGPDTNLVESVVEVESTADKHYVEIQSFTVPVLHNAVAIKFLVFHLKLQVSNQHEASLIRLSMTQLVDIYIRYLVSHFEIDGVDNTINRVEIARIIKSATLEVLQNIIHVERVIVQGVYQRKGSV